MSCAFCDVSSLYLLKQRCPILHFSTKCHHWNFRISRTLASIFTPTGRRRGAARDHTTRGGWLERSDHTVIGVFTAQCVLAENRWAGSATTVVGDVFKFLISALAHFDIFSGDCFGRDVGAIGENPRGIWEIRWKRPTSATMRNILQGVLRVDQPTS